MTEEQTMSPLRARMIEDMKLAGLAATTQEIYLQAVRSLATHYNNPNYGYASRRWLVSEMEGLPGLKA